MDWNDSDRTHGLPNSFFNESLHSITSRAKMQLLHTTAGCDSYSISHYSVDSGAAGEAGSCERGMVQQF